MTYVIENGGTSVCRVSIWRLRMGTTYVDGVPVEDAATIARQAREKAGEIQRLAVASNGQTKELLITYGPLPQRELRLAHAAMMVGFCFL